MFKPSKSATALATHPLDRGLSLARFGLQAGLRLGAYSLTHLITPADQRKQHQHQMLLDQAQLLAHEFGRLKGSVMKIGQLLALYGESLRLPSEVIAALRTLQSDSPPLAWSVIAPLIHRELGKTVYELEIDSKPFAAASIGQVHRAWRRRDNRELCIKIQYPGVAESIESDLNTVAALLMVSQVLPKGFNVHEMLSEVRTMLNQEVDYLQEMRHLQQVAVFIKDDRRFCVPAVFPEYCTSRILTTSYEEGVAIESELVQRLSQIRRNQLATAALELFLQEFFRWNWVQTDPHFGNYRVRLDPMGIQDQWILFDFGAVRRFPQAFLQAYYELVRGAFWHDAERVIKAAKQLNFMPDKAAPQALERFTQLCFLIVEPFTEHPDRRSGLWTDAGHYRWGESDLPQRVTVAATHASLSTAFRVPPKEFVFLHRKLGGVFVLLQHLKAVLNARPLLQDYLT